MPRSPKEILAMTDEQLMEYTLSGEESSHGLGQAALSMRAATRVHQANQEVADLTKQLVRVTKGLVWATCALVVVTAVLVFVTAIHK